MVIAKKWPSNRGPRCAIKPQCDSPWVGRPDAPVPLAWVEVSRIRSFLATWIGRAMSLRISTYRMIVSIRVAPPAGATSTALWPYSASKRKGLAALRPLTPRRSWLRRSDLNRRPLGYEPLLKSRLEPRRHKQRLANWRFSRRRLGPLWLSL